MKISAAEFNVTCRKLIERAAETREPAFIAKRGQGGRAFRARPRQARGLGKGRDTVEILCSDEELFRLGAADPWDAGA